MTTLHFTISPTEQGTLMAALVDRQHVVLDAFSREQSPESRNNLIDEHTKASRLAGRLQHEAQPLPADLDLNDGNVAEGDVIVRGEDWAKIQAAVQAYMALVDDEDTTTTLTAIKVNTVEVDE